MNSLKLLFREIRFRKLNFLLSLLAVTIAVALFVASPMLVDGYARDTQQRVEALESQTDAELATMEDETRKLMLTMGFNLMIVHQDTDMSDFWSSDFAAVEMPQDYVDRLASAEELSLVTHLVATLQQKVEWNGRKVLLVGYLPETPKLHEKQKKPMGHLVEPGTIFLGHELGEGHAKGETIDVLGSPFRIADILPEKGSKEDITIAMNLADAQRVLEKPGKVNQIMAVGCQCAGERLPKIRAQLATVLPETKITEFQSIAVARAEQRDMVAAERAKMVEDLASYRQAEYRRLASLAGVLVPVVVLATGVWVGLLALGNVRERRVEIGLLRALGAGSWKIGGLFLGKALIVGLVGGVSGALLGTVAARYLLIDGMQVPAELFKPAYGLLIGSLIGTPLLCLAASYLPMLRAVSEDPAVILRDA